MTQLKLNAAYFMIIIYVLFFHGSNTAETTCEKDSEKLKSQERGCGNPCAIVQCRNPRAKCVCDGPCGYVCVTPDLRCSSALNKPKQGKVDLPKESQFQSIAEYTCDKGFELIGLKQRMCQSNGKWSGNEPFCTPKGVRCSEPEFELDNAYIVFSTRKDEYYLGDEVKFTCDLGYVNSKKDILISKCEKKDENTADWTPIQINCKPVSCRQPEYIYNGYIEGNKFSLGSEVKYHCNEGYYLVGFATRVCLAEKVWSSSPPTCEIVQCLEPPQIANGAIQYEDDHLNYLSLIYYKCNPGFILDGPSDRQCGELGEFTGEQPECIEIDCGQPEKPENGTISYLEGTKWTQKVHYLCDPHTTTHGSIVAECKFEYQVAFWNPQPPLCILHCKVPGGIMYFERDNKKIKPGEYILHKEIVKMNCESGYEVENSASNSAITSTCVNGKWSDQIQCTPARCFKNTLNERYLKDQRWSTNRIPSIVNSGDTLTLTCDSSYPEVDKNGFLKCAFGKWQLPEPDIKCRKKSCDVTHVNFSNVVIFYKEKQIDADKLDKIGHGEHFRLSCTKDNYELYSNGELGTHRYSKVDCNEGFLSKNIFECREILRCKCSELKQKLLAKGLEPNYCYNDMDNGKSISISCLENYADANRQIVKCQNTHWQIDSNARCKKKCECRSLNLPKSLKLKKWCYDSVKSGTSLEITCAINFTAIAGNEEISCNEGEWLIDAFCLASCKIPNIPQSIISTNIKTTTKKTLTSANNIVHSDRIKISCQLGYYLSSSNDILQCIDGQYDKEIPACLRDFYYNKLTSKEPVIEDSKTIIDYDDLKEQFIEETTTIINNDSPSEEAIIEDSTEIMEIEPTAYIDQTDTVYKNKCTYEPPKDKNLLAFCSGKQLSDTHPTSINLNEVVTFRCYNIESFILVGNKSIKCQFLKWKGTIPTCQALKLRSIENAPVITYHVEKDIGFVNNDGTLVIPQDSKLTLRCWWFKKNRIPRWKWNDQIIPFNNVEQKWNKEEYYELLITKIQPENTGYFTCTTPAPYNKTHGINVKVEERKETPTTSSSTIFTTIPTTERTTTTATTTTLKPTTPEIRKKTQSPIIYIKQNTKCHGLSNTLDVFVNGNPLLPTTQYFNHYDSLIFRCRDAVKYKLYGSISTVCEDGKWTSKWPKCLRIYPNSYYSTPPIEYRSTIPHKRLDVGDYWAESDADHYFLCYYGTSLKQPIMKVNGINIKDNPAIALTVFDYSMRAWFIKTVASSAATRTTFTCQNPDRDLRDLTFTNSITVHVKEKCVLNEVATQKNYNAVVIPRYRRYPFYVFGDVIFFQCDSSGKSTSFPESITCGSGGYWITSEHKKHCP